MRTKTSATDNDIAAIVTCECGKVYMVRWLPERKVHGLPIECECGVQGETLEHEARMHLDEEERHWLRREGCDEEPYHEANGPREAAHRMAQARAFK